jgi:hypothetical protein
MNLPKGNHIGLLAQELEEILPNLVKGYVHDVYDKVPGVKVLTDKGESEKEEDYGC